MIKRPRKPAPIKTRIRSALRAVWLRSPQRTWALKRDNYTCQECGVRQSTAKGREVKVVVHHLEEIDWDGLCELIIERILHDPSRLQTLCVKCHKAHHAAQKKGHI